MILAAPSFKLVAGHLALDFANTLDNRYQPGRKIDLIASYPEFLRFCMEAGVLTPALAAKLARLEQGKDSALRKADQLREALHRVFVAVSDATPPAAEDLALLSDSVKEAARHRALQFKTGRTAAFEWQWIDLEQNAGSPLWPIAEAAAGLLVSGHLQHVRQCAGNTCRWLFLDTSKNRSRRWCDMKLCGNRIKARNYYQRGREHPGS